MIVSSIAALVIVLLAFATALAARRRARARARTVPTLKGQLHLPDRPTPLSDRARQRYANELAALADRFNVSPVETLREMERLVGRILRDRGYPYLDPNARPEAVEGHFPTVAEEYRAARNVMQRFESGNTVPADAMRETLGNYRTVTGGLLDSA